MTHPRLFSVALTLCLLTPLLASAQDTPTDVRVEEFTDGDRVTGTYQTPDGSQLLIHLTGPRATLIRARTSFRPELLKSVENL